MVIGTFLLNGCGSVFTNTGTDVVIVPEREQYLDLSALDLA